MHNFFSWSYYANDSISTTVGSGTLVQVVQATFLSKTVCITKNGVYGNGLSLIHSFRQECLQLTAIALVFCLSTTDD